MSSLADKEMEEQITAVGNTLLQLPSLHDELLPLLDQIEDLLKKVEQSPSRSMQTALSPLMQALVVEELLKHSDVDVKVGVASCISEIIRISAPDAPYDDDKLKDVFQLIVSSFENLSDTTSGSYDKRSTMLKTMAGCRSCVIMLDLECDQMIIEMFHNFLKAIRVNHAEAVFDSMEAIMILVLEESQDICPDLLIPILDTLKMNNQDVMPIAKKLAERVIQNSADMIRPYLAQSVKKLNADSDDFGKVVALVCRENTDIVGNSNESISRDQPASDTIEYGENLVGSKVKVWWAKDRMYYEGEIVSFDSAKKKHKVYYTDGEKEVLNLKRERWEFVGDDSVSDEAADVEHSSNDTSSDVQRKKKKGNTNFQSSKSRKRQKKYGSPKSKLKDTATKSGGKSKDDGKPESEFKVNNTKPSRNSIYNASIKPRDQPLRLGGKSQGDSAKASSGIRSKDNPAKTPSHPAKQDSQRSTAESIGKIPQSGKPLTKTSLSSKVKESGNPPTKTSSSSKAYWRMFKVRSVYRNRQNHIIAIQSLWRQNLAKRELRRLKKEANEAGALRLAKGKLEKQLEDLTWKLHLEKKIRVSNEESKSVEISKLQKTVESLTLELEVAKLGILNEFNKNRLPKRQVELSAKEKSALEREVASLNEFRNENALLKGNREVLLRCIKENLGFRDGKPVAACVIYKCLLHWHAFEFKRTGTFDLIIESINNVFKDGDEDATLPYWLSNTSALLCLLQRNLRSNGFLTAGSQCSVGSTGVNGKLVQGPKSSFKYRGGLEDGLSHMEAKSPAVLFKQQLAACVEKIFGYIRDNLKKEISPLLGQCIQVPEKNRVHGGNSSRSPSGVPQQSPSSGWDSIIKFLDLLMSRLRGNYVPSFFIRKLTAEVFSFINIQLFNSLLLRRECCTFSNGEYIKSGLAELEKWIVNATEEFAGTSWHELNYIRQAVGFLVLHQKRKKSLDEIRQDLCPKLSVRQIYRISTMYWDDKNGTQSVSIEVLSQMRDIVNKGSQNIGSSNSLLLDDDLSIPLFSMEDVYMSIPAMDPSDIELPQFFFE